MTTAAILQQAGLVPTVPRPQKEVGTPQNKAQSHVPAVPTVPTQNSRGATAIRDAVEPYYDLAADQLDVIKAMQHDTAERRAGRVPAGDTARMLCNGCGPVWIHPTIADVLPVVGGWPRALGCPWYFVRRAGGFVPRCKLIDA